MVKISSSSSKKDKTKKSGMTAIDAGLVKIQDGEKLLVDTEYSNKKMKKEKKRKADHSFDQSVNEETNTDEQQRKKRKKEKKRKTDDSIDQSVNEETNTDEQQRKKKKKEKKRKANDSFDQSVNEETNTDEQQRKKRKKEKKNKLDKSLEQSVSTEESPAPTNIPDAQSKLNGKKNKLGRFEKLKVIEEARKQKQQEIDPSGTAATPTTPSSLQDMKINLDDLQPDLGGGAADLPPPPMNRKARKLALKAKKAQALSRVDTDTDSDAEEAKEDDAVCQSYKNDFGFEEVVEAVSEEKNFEEDKLEEQKLQETAKKKKKTEREGTELERTVEVINVHVKTSKKVLLAIFRKLGKVESMRYRNIPVENLGKYKMNQIMKNTLDKKRSSMTAFVKFVTVEGANNALQANTTEVCGHHILVRPCIRPTTHQQREHLSKGCTIMLGNLPFDAEEESIYQHFESCGGIVNISILRNKLKAVGTAFVEFKTKDAVAAALKLDNTELQRRSIRVSKAVRKVKANKKQVKPPPSTRSPATKPGRPYSINSGANKPFTPYQKKPVRTPGTGANSVAPVKAGSVQSRLSRPDAQQPEGATPRSAAAPTPGGGFTGSKFDQPQKGAAKLAKKKLNKEEIKKVMLAKKLAGKKKSV